MSVVEVSFVGVRVRVVEAFICKTYAQLCAGDVDYVLVLQVPESGAKDCTGLAGAGYVS